MSETNIKTEDLDLARAATGGDEKAWRRIYDETNQQLYNFLCYQTGDRDAAHDLLQETYVAALRRLDGFRGQGTLLSWLRSVGLEESVWTGAVGYPCVYGSSRHLARENSPPSHPNRRGGDVPRSGRWTSGVTRPPVPQAAGSTSPPRIRGPAVSPRSPPFWVAANQRPGSTTTGHASNLRKLAGPKATIWYSAAAREELPHETLFENRNRYQMDDLEKEKIWHGRFGPGPCAGGRSFLRRFSDGVLVPARPWWPLPPWSALVAPGDMVGRFEPVRHDAVVPSGHCWPRSPLR